MSQGFTFSHLPGGIFDARGVDPSPSYVVPPYDDYIVGAVAQEAEENSKGTGGFLNYTLEIQQSRSGSLQYAKVRIPYRLNIFHNDPGTREMGYKQLSGMAHAIGRLQLAGPADLLCNPQTGQGYFIATIGPQKNKDGSINEQYSNVYAVKDLQGNIPGKSTTSAVAATPAAPPPVAQPPAVQYGQPAASPQTAPAVAPWQQPAAAAPAQAAQPTAQPQWMPPGYVAPAAPATAQPATVATPPWQQPAAAAPAQQAAQPTAVPPWQR